MFWVRLFVAGCAAYIVFFILNSLGTLSFLRWLKGNTVVNIVFSAVAVVIFLAVLLYPYYLEHKKRTNEFDRIATRLGFTSHRGEFQPDRSLLMSPLLQRGFRGVFGPAFTGKHERVEIAVFDYQYSSPGDSSDSGDSSYLHTVVALHEPGVHISDFVMTPESFGDRFFGGLFGDKDVDFEDDPDFSRRYVLSGPNEEAVRDFFDPRLRSAFMHGEENWAASAINNNLILFKDGDSDERVSTEDLVNYLEKAMAIFDVIRSTHGHSTGPSKPG